jgi:hypothetical protein
VFVGNFPQDAHGLPHHFRADAVAGEKNDVGFHFSFLW